ncbi:uncharacterized protein LOC128548817 [Mercenaria mercenaria]|uniref:uncharacterized protein LOC128548817 n=1 Tax=Mercenaria mercenaria TaxID=6596 RepID=UPI00234F2ADA|nr:uncharacterized protein LOC128548817 [Mercenaria mercenaria]
MKLGKRKVVFYLFFVLCTVVIAWNFYVTIKRPQNGYNINNQMHLKASLQNHEYNGNVSSERNYSNSTEQRRIEYGIQMGGEQIRIITETLQEKGNLLVWGLGNDSPYWHNSTKGKVVFIEDDIPKRKAGIMWYDKIVKQYSFLEVYRVHYTTNTVKSFKKYINSPEIWFELDLSNQLPASVTQTHWHVIIIDAPLGCCQKGPGRYQSIYTSRVLGSKGTHVFVDDFERKVEHEFSIKVFGKPVEVIQRRSTNASRANEQAHFIFSSYNQTGMGQRKKTKPDILITPVLNIAENVNNN